MPESVFLVTGGAGFIGHHLIRGLLASYPSACIYSVDLYFTGSKANHVIDERVEYLEGSTCDLSAIMRRHSCPPPKVVFHLGEYSRVSQSFGELDRVWEYNILGTKEVVRFCLEHGVRLVYAGSSSALGNDGDDEHLSPYAWTKSKNTEYIRNVSTWYGLDYVITHFYNVYGPGQIANGPYATAIGIFEEQMRAGSPLTVTQPGTQTRDFTHVGDIVDGVILCAERGRGDGYLLGAGQEHRLIDVARMFGGPVEMVPERRGERARGRASESKAHDLGWKPTRRLSDYIAAARKDRASSPR